MHKIEKCFKRISKKVVKSFTVICAKDCATGPSRIEHRKTDILRPKAARIAYFSGIFPRDIGVDLAKNLNLEIRKISVGAAKHHANPLSWMRFVNAEKEGCKSGCAAGFRDQAQLLPKDALSFDNLFVANQQ